MRETAAFHYQKKTGKLKEATIKHFDSLVGRGCNTKKAFLGEGRGPCAAIKAVFVCMGGWGAGHRGARREGRVG